MFCGVNTVPKNETGSVVSNLKSVMEDFSKSLARLGCPVKVTSSSQLVGETRLQLLEWLLSKYDKDFFEQCARESSSRTTRIGRQLFALGLGGNKQAQCEAFVAAGSGSNIEDTLNVASELVDMIALSGEMETDEVLKAR